MKTMAGGGLWVVGFVVCAMAALTRGQERKANYMYVRTFCGDAIYVSS